MVVYFINIWESTPSVTVLAFYNISYKISFYYKHPRSRANVASWKEERTEG